MKNLVSPKQVARAIGVSESSVKRWCDAGLIATQRTSGGHRRIPISSVVGYLRDHSQELERPELLGLPATVGGTDRMLTRGVVPLRDALLEGDETHARRIVIDLYLSGQSLRQIGDSLLAPAFRQIGDLWDHGSAEVYQERRACEIGLRLIRELRGYLAIPPATAAIAIGGAPEADAYSLPTSLVELTLLELGWNATSLGDTLPFDSLAKALETHRPRLFWLSVSHVEDEAEFRLKLARFVETASPEVSIAVGGRAVTRQLKESIIHEGSNQAGYCRNLEELASFAGTLLDSAPAP